MKDEEIRLFNSPQIHEYIQKWEGALYFIKNPPPPPQPQIPNNSQTLPFIVPFYVVGTKSLDSRAPHIRTVIDAYRMIEKLDPLHKNFPKYREIRDAIEEIERQYFFYPEDAIRTIIANSEIYLSTLLASLPIIVQESQRVEKTDAERELVPSEWKEEAPNPKEAVKRSISMVRQVKKSTTMRGPILRRVEELNRGLEELGQLEDLRHIKVRDVGLEYSQILSNISNYNPKTEITDDESRVISQYLILAENVLAGKPNPPEISLNKPPKYVPAPVPISPKPSASERTETVSTQEIISGRREAKIHNVAQPEAEYAVTPQEKIEYPRTLLDFGESVDLLSQELGDTKQFSRMRRAFERVTRDMFNYVGAGEFETEDVNTQIPNLVGRAKSLIPTVSKMLESYHPKDNVHDLVIKRLEEFKTAAQDLFMAEKEDYDRKKE